MYLFLHACLVKGGSGNPPFSYSSIFHFLMQIKPVQFACLKPSRSFYKDDQRGESHHILSISQRCSHLCQALHTSVALAMAEASCNFYHVGLDARWPIAQLWFSLPCTFWPYFSCPSFSLVTFWRPASSYLLHRLAVAANGAWWLAMLLIWSYILSPF